ncbi:MAG: hypothetical protein Q7R66_09700 [Undibacterium sp.]|uniref:hypothetical protein n=1 Tax=Undibacterium sp. TaxID=1914977 RepID=UPI002728CE5B|nr:hypothetical protein [Undibacterium sp.]MDO8652451.1 hypothetical protein [Undibacterium sp.]
MRMFVNTVKEIARRMVGHAGGVLLSKKIYQQVLLQRRNAADCLAAIESAKLRPGLACIVFSKDRPLQLYSLLHSYFEKVRSPVPVTVIYDVSDEAFARAYQEVSESFVGREVSVTFVRELNGFRESLLQELQKIEVQSVFFLVDDIVFIRPLDLDWAKKLNPQEFVLSLRHSPHLRRSYTGNAKVAPPMFSNVSFAAGLLSFKWFECGYEWSDPWSVDGQVLSTAEVRVLTRISEFKAPNSYEVALKAFNDMAEKRLGLCYTESKILNLPINRVQSEISNLSGNISCAYLLEQWNQGLMLDTQMFDNHIPVSPHEVHAVQFKMRP